VPHVSPIFLHLITLIIFGEAPCYQFCARYSYVPPLTLGVLLANRLTPCCPPLCARQVSHSYQTTDKIIFLYCVTYRSIAKSQLCKQPTVKQPLLGDNSVDTLFPRPRENTIMEETFSLRSVLVRLRSEKPGIVRETRGLCIGRSLPTFRNNYSRPEDGGSKSLRYAGNNLPK
jgi:hypothetical protein